MELKIPAHIREDGTEQSLEDHLTETGKLAAEFCSEFGLEALGSTLGRAHDIGKNTKGFEKRIRSQGPKVDHATAGAQGLFKLSQQRWNPYLSKLFLACPVMSHHSGLPDFGSKIDSSDGGTLFGRLKKKVPDCSEVFQIVNPEIPDAQLLRKIKFHNEKDFCFQMSFAAKMVYSALVDADYLDTERFMSDGNVKRAETDSLDAIDAVVTEKITVKGWLEEQNPDSIGGRRSEILRHCIEQGKTTERGLFKLSAPTGSGKTVSSFMFALKHAVHNRLRRIIYVIPYSSIIEQNAMEFRNLAGNSNVLEHHSGFDFTQESEELKMLELATENWDIPIVVTTSNQFFESLYGYKTSASRKIHNIANSVVIFDEAQKLPSEFLIPCLEAVRSLNLNFGVSAVFCTATQPAIGAVFKDLNNMTELCPRVDEQFAYFKRTNFENLGVLSKQDLIAKLENEDQALCIVNTRKSAQELFSGLNHDGREIFHLSTAMHKKHRQETIRKINQLIQEGKPCIVISTSLVEAGVDMDFQSVYRQLAPLDSLIQAAGRCNRNGKRNRADCSTYIFDFDEDKSPKSLNRQIKITRSLIEENKNLNLEDPELINEYFRRVYNLAGQNALDSKGIIAMLNKQNPEFRNAGSNFKLISNDDYKVLINENDEIGQSIEKIEAGFAEKKDFRKIQNYSINVNEQLIRDYLGAGYIQPINNLEKTYILVSYDKYTAELGLDLSKIEGEALFL